jgi:TolB-like protein
LLYSFEDYALDTDRRELRRGGELVSVEPKVFDFLAHLIANRERVVSRDDLITAVWNGRIVSESALTTCINAARSALGDSGEAQRLIKTLPRKGIRFIGAVREEARLAAMATPDMVAPRSMPPLTLPDRPSIAVLPFINLSGDPEQEYFADGVVEDIIAALSRMHALFVIARNSSFTYKGQSVDVRQVGRELGVRYVLEGSVRKSANRMRIASHLFDTATGASLAANRFEGTLDDVFTLQDQVTESVVGAIAPTLEQAEIGRAQRKPTGNLDAYDLFLRGMASYYQWTKEGTDDALGLWRRATEIDPGFALAYAMAGMAYFRRKGARWVTDPDEESAETARLAGLAVQAGKSDAGALSFAGFSRAYVAGQLDDGVANIERALALNPNLASAHYASGWARTWLGEPELAIQHFVHAMRLSPRDPSLVMMHVGTAHAHFFADRIDDASSWAELALRDYPNAHAALRIAAASHALAGRAEKAKRLAEKLQQIDPELRIANFRWVLGPYRRAEHLAKYENALRQAGLPD